MDVSQIDLVGRQITNAASGRARAGLAEVSRETSVVRQANRLFSSAIRAEKQQERKNTPQKDGVYTATDKAAPQPMPDGYVRRSSVQAMRVARDYKARIVKRVIMAIFGLAVAALVLYVLFDLIKF